MKELRIAPMCDRRCDAMTKFKYGSGTEVDDDEMMM